MQKRKQLGGSTVTDKSVLFLHSGFRTSSTWLWLKFRGVEGVRAYYEPFHEGLASMDKAAATSFGPTSWNSHHPVSDPYFIEFADIIGDEGGIDLFRTEMAFERYVPTGGVDGELSAAEVNYLSLLIGSAHRAGDIPFLCDTRSLARSRALRKAFGGTHVLLTRNLHEQWCSFSEQALHGNSFFFDCMFRQIEAGSHDPFFGRIGELASRAHGRTDTAEAYALFLLFQLYSNAVAFDACQIHVDSTAIAGNHVERRAVEARLSRMLPSEIDLGDVTAHVSYSNIETRNRIPAEAIARQYLSELVVPNASAACQQYIRTAFDAAFQCWDKSIYHAEATRVFLGQKLDQKLDQISALESQLSDLQARLEHELEGQLSDFQARLEHEQRKVAFAEEAASRARHEILYLTNRSIWEDLIFRPSGKPKKAFRYLLFHRNGKPRKVFKRLILHSSGRPRQAFRMWMTGKEYQSLDDPLRLPDDWISPQYEWKVEKHD